MDALEMEHPSGDIVELGMKSELDEQTRRDVAYAMRLIGTLQVPGPDACRLALPHLKAAVGGLLHESTLKGCLEKRRDEPLSGELTGPVRPNVRDTTRNQDFLEHQRIIVCPLHWYYRADHLAEVVSLMRVLGPPVLRGFLDQSSGVVMLSEGTHRIRAAHALGLVPKIMMIPWWRSKYSLERARYAARRRGIAFPQVHMIGEVRA